MAVPSGETIGRREPLGAIVVLLRRRKQAARTRKVEFFGP